MCQPKQQSALGPFVAVVIIAVAVVGYTTKADAEGLPKPKLPKIHRPALEQPRPSGKGRAGEVARVAYDAGFRGKGLTTAVAVALAESGGRWGARCHNCIPGYREDSRCAFQINVNAHPRYRGSSIYQPRTCARAAYAISGGGTNWRPWSTYKNGSYRRHLGTARRAVGRL